MGTPLTGLLINLYDGIACILSGEEGKQNMHKNFRHSDINIVSRMSDVWSHILLPPKNEI